MRFQIGVWKKVYLFYGVVFFGIGLFGFLFNSRSDLSGLTRNFLDGFSEELAEVGLVRTSESRVVNGINRKTPTVVLNSWTANGGSQYESMVEEIKARMGERARVIHYSAPGRDWLKSFQVRSLISKEQPFIGLERIESPETADRLGMVFTATKWSASRIFNQLISQNPELPLFKLEQIFSQDISLYRLSFTESTVFTEHWIKVAAIILDELESIPDIRIGHTFQF